MHRDSLLTLIGACFLALMLVETVFYFWAPRLYARAAVVPLAPPRRIPLDRLTREALAAPPDARAGYRQSAAGRVDLGRLALPPKLETSAVVLHFFPHDRLATARLPYQFTNKTLALARVDLAEVDGAIELRARFVTYGWPTVLVVAPVAAIALLAKLGLDEGTAPMFGMGFLFVLLNVGLGWLMARGRLLDGVAQIEAQIVQAMANAAQPARWR